jgi:hypothetical protein
METTVKSATDSVHDKLMQHVNQYLLKIFELMLPKEETTGSYPFFFSLNKLNIF